MAAAAPLTCKELVELVTRYVEGALPALERGRFEAHIRECGKCAIYLEQLRTTVRLTGRLTEESLDPGMRRRLLAVFRGWRAVDRAPE
ncbi:MAG: anti-sigma factor family protein [Dehalococcoidia bacterium]